jgi:uncharacterized protein
VDATVTTDGGYTLLMQASTSGQPHIAEFLINKGVSVHATDEYGYAALHHAALSASTGTDTMRLLLAHGAVINTCTHLQSDIALLAAVACSGQRDRVELLLDAGADVLRFDASGGTALHMAVRFAHADTVKLLLEHGADAVLDRMQCHACTCCGPVSALMMCKNTDILKLLLTAGADVHAVTSSGDTCLHIAARQNYSAPVICLLVKAGADMHAINSAGMTAADVAHYYGNTLIEQLLIRAAQQA